MYIYTLFRIYNTNLTSAYFGLNNRECDSCMFSRITLRVCRGIFYPEMPKLKMITKTANDRSKVNRQHITVFIKPFYDFHRTRCNGVIFIR
jgi:hypothetical protein